MLGREGGEVGFSRLGRELVTFREVRSGFQERPRERETVSEREAEKMKSRH